MSETYVKKSYKTKVHRMPSLEVVSTGFAKCKSFFRWGPGVKSFFVLHYVVAGEGNFTVDGKTYHIQKNSTFCIFPNEEVSYAADPKHPWTYYWVGFNGRDARFLISKTSFSNMPVFWETPGGETIDLIRKIYSSSGTEPENVTMMTGLLYQLLATYMKACSPSFEENTDHRLQSALAFIHTNYAKAISNDDISASCGTSNTLLNHLFHKYQGCSPIQYLIQYRIDMALELIVRTDLNVRSIAQAVGYTDELYFIRAFKKRVGCSPMRYRELSRQSKQKEK